MSQTYAVPLNTEWSTVTFDHEFLTVLKSRGLEPQIEERWSVGTIRHGSEESSGYLCVVLSHLEAPLDEIDVVAAERKEAFCCGCPGWRHHAYDDQIGAPIDECRHVEAVKKERRTEVDDSQATLEL
jgi:hypothetical protein